MPGPVVIVKYDSKWPMLYEQETKRVLKAVCHIISVVEHIGSTAVPGLGAKPIIDMMAGVQSQAEADECLKPLRRIGYTDVTPQPGHIEWFYCLGKAPHSTGYHLHLVKFMSSHWVKQLVFRDYLRNHPDTAHQYFRLKKSLSAKYGSDRIGYTEAKTVFIESVLAQVRKEAS